MTSGEDQDDRLDNLAHRARLGDAHAFDELCRELSDDVWRYCAALLGDREQAYDAAQDTFVRLVSAVRRWRGEGRIRPFVLVIARRAVADFIRGQQRRRRLDDGTPVSADPPSPARTGSIEMQELIDTLDPDQKQAFVLTQVVGLQYDEAAQIAGVAIGTIRSRVSRARAHLIAAITEAEGH